MTHDKEIDYDEWGRRLESGDHTDPLLDLGNRMQDLYLPADNPSPTFENNLRERLLDQFVTNPGYRSVPTRRLLIGGLIVLAVLILTVTGVQLIPGNVPTVSAAEIFEKASLRLSERLAPDDVIYDRVMMDWKKGGFQRDDVVTELWRTADGSNLRYQMYDENDLLYFDQHDSESLWRSSYVRPVYGNAINFVYQAPYVPGHTYLNMGDKQLAAQFLFRDLSTFWSNIDQMVSDERKDCQDFFCILSSLGQGWECSDDRCVLNHGSIFEEEDTITFAEVTGKGYTKDGQEVYEVRTYLPDIGDRWYTIFKFDTTTYDLLEIEDYSRGKLQFHIRLVERKVLSWADLPDDFFRTIPESVEVRPWESDIPLGRKEDDYAWIISADPTQGASLSGVVTIQAEIGYRLASIESAKVGLGLAWTGHDYMESIEYDKVPVKGGEGTVRISFTVDADNLGEGMWAIRPMFFDTMGIDTAWNGGVTSQEILLEYCVRCTSEP